MANRHSNADTEPTTPNSKETTLVNQKICVKYSYQKNKSQKPRRNKSAFIIFSSEARSKLRLDQEEGLNSNDVMVKLAELWKNLSKEERDRFNQLAKKDKQRYQQELAEFAKEYPNDMISNKTKNNHVKKPCSAYGIFLKERKANLKQEQPKLKMAEILKIVSQEWKTISENEKQIYQDKASLEKEVARNKLTEAILKDHNKTNHTQEPSVKKKKKQGKKKMEDVEDVKVEINVKTEPSLIPVLNPKTSNVASEALTKSEDSVLFANFSMGQSDIQVKAEDLLPLLPLDEKQNSISNFFQNPTLDLMIKSSLFLKEKDSSGKESGLFSLLNQGVQRPNDLLADMLNLNLDLKISGMSMFEPSIYKVKSDSKSSISQYLNTSQASKNSNNMRSKFLNEAIINALGNSETVESLFEDSKI